MKTTRSRLVGLSAALLTTGALVVGGLAGMSPATAAGEAPSVTVSQTVVSAAGETTVTVTGTGFDPSLAIGTRPPLIGEFAGVYAVFGKFAPTWKPSDNAPSANRTAATGLGQKWAVPAASMATIGGAPAGAIELKADGSFVAQVQISKSAIDTAAAAKPGNTTYGIYTYAGSGAKTPSYETFTPIKFTTATTASKTKLKVGKKKRAKKVKAVRVSVATGEASVASGTVNLTFTRKVRKRVATKRAQGVLGADGTVIVKQPKLAKGQWSLAIDYTGNAVYQGSSATLSVRGGK